MSVQQMCSGTPALVPGELRGYRMWRVRSGQLVATNAFNGEWMRGRLEAMCRRGDMTAPTHEAPNEQCQCGIYGWYRPTEARLHRGDVFGVVAVSGRVLLGDFGFRAQRGRVLAVVVEPPVRLSGSGDTWSTAWSPSVTWEDREPFIEWCASNGVAVFESREQLLEEFPPEDVRELLGREIPPDPAPQVVWHSAIPAAYAQAQMAAAMAEMRAAMLKEAERFIAQMMKLAEAACAGGASMSDLARAIRRRDRQPRPAPFMQPALDSVAPDVRVAMRQALDQRKQGTRGPEKRRRGRARLSL